MASNHGRGLSRSVELPPGLIEVGRAIEVHLYILSLLPNRARLRVHCCLDFSARARTKVLTGTPCGMAASERLLVNKYISCMAASCFLSLALSTAALPPLGAHS